MTLAADTSIQVAGRKRARSSSGPSQCSWHARRKLRVDGREMAGHLEQTYFAYLPEPVFFSGDTFSLQLENLGKHILQVEGAQQQAPHARNTAGILEGRQDQSCSQSKVDACGADVEADAIDLDSSSLIEASSQTSLLCETVFLGNINGLTVADGPATVHSSLRQHEEPPADTAPGRNQIKHTTGPHVAEVTQASIISQPQTEQARRAALAELSMQMVIRSQQALASGADELARPESAAEQAIFDALVANSESIDDDALVVNHPCRHYDVANFLTRWAYERYVNRICLPVEPGSDSHMRRLDQCRRVTRRDRSEPQGLPWASLGTTRSKALEARQLLHPATPGNQPCEHPAQTSAEHRCYRFQSFNARHRPRWAHFQLRNMITARSRNEVFYAAGNTVQAAMLSLPEQQSTIMDLATASDSTLPLHITCLASADERSDQVLIAGGFNGEYAMITPGVNEQPTRGFVSHDYNGLITHISVEEQRRSGSLQATISSNDCHIRLLDIKTQRITADHKFCTSVNATATSPDGRLRLIVDDTCEPQIVDAEKGDKLVALSGHTGFGFACAWSADSRYAATAAQDGRTNIWDTRSWSTPLETVISTMSCVRSLHFTDDNLLVMAENEDIVTIWDVQQRSKQNLDFFGSVAGVALLDGGNEIVVANSDRTVGGLMVFERQLTSYHWEEEVVFNDRSKGSLSHNVEVAAAATDTFEDLMI